MGELADPLEGPADLDPLLDRVGEARCVLLGEASHGTSEYYEWRSRISERLILEKGFSFIAVEGDWPDCYELNRFVKGYPGSDGDARAALGAFEPRDHRAIGVVYDPAYERYGNYVPTVLPRRYDAFVYLDETRALHPLRVRERRAAGDVIPRLLYRRGLSRDQRSRGSTSFSKKRKKPSCSGPICCT